jgi:DNA-binding FadR family transcriptional regulator
MELPMSTAVDMCCQTLRGDILEGTYQPGERLPAERKLADAMGVNRVTIRSALSQLAAAKLVRVRQGSGYEVQDYRRVGGLDLIEDVMTRADSLGRFTEVAEDLLLIRRHLAQAVLERLSEHPPRAGALNEIEVAIAAFGRAVEAAEDTQSLAERDMDIVLGLLNATGSSVLGLCLNPISQTLWQSRALRQAIYADPRANLDGWRALVPWLIDPTLMPVAGIMEAFKARDTQSLQRLAALEAVK